MRQRVGRRAVWAAVGVLGVASIATVEVYAFQQQQQRRPAATPGQSVPDAEHGGGEVGTPAPAAPQQGVQPRAGRAGGAAAGAPGAPAGGGGGGFGGLVAYPAREKAPQEVLDRGKATYSVNCSFCHGSDAAGGSVGPNLLRSDVVLQDKDGELIMPIVHGARMDRGMPRIEIADAQVKDVAGWLHSLRVASRSGPPEKPIDIVVGSAVEGKPTFDKTCGSCHSVAGDLKGFGGKYTDPRAMQQAWLLPGGGGGRGGGPGGGAAAPSPLHVPPTTVTITQANGQKITGTLGTIDDFYVATTTPDGVLHRFTRDGDKPKVEINDPLKAHRALFPVITDKEIHDITAYLVTIK